MALKHLRTLPSETLAVGDRLETDIAGAQAAGIHTALVLTGVSSIKQAQEYNPNPTRTLTLSLLILQSWSANERNEAIDL